MARNPSENEPRKATAVDRQTFALGPYEPVVGGRLNAMERDEFVPRLWRGDPGLWTKDAGGQAVIRNALGWLRVAEKMKDNLDDLLRFAAEMGGAGFRYAVHMGMGGSALAPRVLERTVPRPAVGLPLAILDTTDPATILEIERTVPLGQTLFIIASKSGTTAEPNAFGEYFYAKVRGIKGDRAGENFVAVTDPGTPLASQGRERHYRRVFLNFPNVGGRYSALSYFGLVPAALAGLDVAGLLDRALVMARACASGPAKDNPGVALGAVMGELAKKGRDKVTVLVSEPAATLGMWLEQLMAESTGKDGTGLLPVAGEPVGDPRVYGDDRLFAYVRLGPPEDGMLDRSVAALRAAGHPVVTIQMDDPLDLAQEFFRWEIATATAGAILGINAFDQPNVQESKDNTNRLLAVVRAEGRLPDEAPAFVEGHLSIYAEQAPGPAATQGTAATRGTAAATETAAAMLASFLAQSRPGDYIALMAYLTERPETDEALERIRVRLRDATRLATTVGYGPRFLHSTGQYHKGGPNTGLFIQLTADDAADAPIPGAPYTFGVFKRAQALGDLEALRKHGRRAVRVHLGRDASEGLRALEQVIAAALQGLAA